MKKGRVGVIYGVARPRGKFMVSQRLSPLDLFVTRYDPWARVTFQESLPAGVLEGETVLLRRVCARQCHLFDVPMTIEARDKGHASCMGVENTHVHFHTLLFFFLSFFFLTEFRQTIGYLSNT